MHPRASRAGGHRAPCRCAAPASGRWRRPATRSRSRSHHRWRRRSPVCDARVLAAITVLRDDISTGIRTAGASEYQSSSETRSGHASTPDSAGCAGRCVSARRVIRPFSLTQLLFDDRHAGPQDPLRTPRRQVTPRRRTDRGEQIAPGGVAVRVLRAGTDGRRAGRPLADEIVELPQDARRLVVDDRSVVALGLVEIVELLPHRRRAGRGIGAVGHGLVAQVERLPRRRRPVSIAACILAAMYVAKPSFSHRSSNHRIVT